MAKPRRTIPSELPRTSRSTVEVDPAWLEDGTAAERPSRASRMSGAPDDRRTIDVDPTWLERTTTPPTGARGKQKPPPLPRTPVAAKAEEEPEDEAPARVVIPPPLPKTPRASKKPPVRR